MAGSNYGGNIHDCYSTGAVSGSSNVGGLVGSNHDGGTLTTCYSTGSVSGLYNVGGLVGENRDSSIIDSIIDCYSTGAVSGSSNVGGLVGYIRDSSIIDCYSTGAVSGSSNVGGFIGYRYSGTVTGSFWDTQTSGKATGFGNSSATVVTGKTTAEMKTLSTFTSAGWDFTTIWDICETTNYPRLQWQIPETDWMCPDGVNIEDLDYFVNQWLENNCDSSNGYCSGMDIDISGKVDMADWAIFAEGWLEGL